LSEPEFIVFKILQNLKMKQCFFEKKKISLLNNPVNYDSGNSKRKITYEAEKIRIFVVSLIYSIVNK
jgi:hypothetical protein